jgi:hypothetical protein
MYGMHAMSKTYMHCVVYGYGKEAGISAENVFFIFMKHMKKQKICSKLKSHIFSDNQCAVYIRVTIQYHPLSTPVKRERAIRRYIS